MVGSNRPFAAATSIGSFAAAVTLCFLWIDAYVDNRLTSYNDVVQGAEYVVIVLLILLGGVSYHFTFLNNLVGFIMAFLVRAAPVVVSHPQHASLVQSSVILGFSIWLGFTCIGSS
tara:strand:- start:194 stop:541 length:348 start_codon:yes stop_codon:yes gene_type:complete